MDEKVKSTPVRRKWQQALEKSHAYYGDFEKSGDKVVDQYRIEKKSATQQEKYNILFSNTETIKPSLYAQSPEVVVERTYKDNDESPGLYASMLMEQALKYQLKEQDFDDVIDSVVEDYLLPGLGQAWVRYSPTFGIDPETQAEMVASEQIAFDYVFWKDFRTNKARRWSEVWWVAKRSYMTKDEVAKRFDDKNRKVSTKMTFKRTTSASTENAEDIPEDQAPIWEIWNKRDKEIIWFSENYAEDVLDRKPDPLGLKDFFPCPRPVRAITTNNTFIPRPFYSQYQAQADELNDITSRIRRLVDALRVVGIYDASLPELKSLLTGTNNKMVPVENWSTMQEKGGLKGTVDFLSIQEIAGALMQLYDARERVKAEIYEITGWSDIIRGTSKASETLGAQRIKADWAGSRLKRLQKEIQRFVRDLLRIAGEIVAEHFQPETLIDISGIELSKDPNVMPQQMAMIKQVTAILSQDKSRCSLVTIETDSTLLPDETQDKETRMEFLGAAGAYLQQAVPALQAEPRLGQLMGEILMFAVRSFRSARPLEEAFKQFTKSFQQQGPTPPQQPGQEQAPKGPDPAIEQGKMEVKKAEIDQKGQIAQAELNQERETDMAELELKRQAEDNRHAEKMAELALREREVAVKEAELGIKRDELASEEAMEVERMNRDDVNRAEDRAESARNERQNDDD